MTICLAVEHKICSLNCNFIFFLIVYIMPINVHDSWIKGQDSYWHNKAIEQSWNKLSDKTKNILSKGTPYLIKEIPYGD